MGGPGRGGAGGGPGWRGDGHKIQFLFKMDLPSVGFLEMTLGAGKEQVDVSVYGPDSVTAHSGLIAEDLGRFWPITA